MNNKNLFIILIVLLGIYGITRLTSNRQERSFDTDLISVDTTQVTAIIIQPKGEEPEITLSKEGNAWLASNGQISATAQPGAVSSLLESLTEIKTNRIAAKKKEKWSEYEVEEGNGTRVQVFKDKKLLEDFIVGRFSFNQQTRSGTSFVRINEEEEVYAVEGFLTMNLSRDFNSYRDRSIFQLPTGAEITKLDLQYPDTLYQLVKVGGQWLLNSTQEALDSSAVANYLNVLQNISATDFADDFDETRAPDFFHQSITIHANNLQEPQTLSCYIDTTHTPPFIIGSTQNREAYFASDTTGVYERVFKDIGEFQLQEE